MRQERQHARRPRTPVSRIMSGICVLAMLFLLPAPASFASHPPQAQPTPAATDTRPRPVPDVETGPKVLDLGPASLVTSTMVAEQIGDRIYAASNGLTPVLVGAYDPAQHRVTKTYKLPTGTGAWAMAHVGTDLYVGVYGPAHLYKIDTVRGTVRKVAELGTWIWSLTAAPDGKLFAGTYPRGEVWRYDPKTGKAANLGRVVPDQQYVRSIAATRTTIYAGVGTDAHLVAIDRRTGRKTNLLPSKYSGRTFVATLSLSRDGRTLATSLTPKGTLLVFRLGANGLASGAPVEVQARGETFSSAVQVAANGDIYFGARPTGNLYRYRPATRKLTNLGAPYPGATFYRIFPGRDDQSVLRAEVETGVVEYDPASRTYSTSDLAEAGLVPGPELPMAIAVADSKVLVSGKHGMQIHDIGTGASHRVPMPGEAKAITPVGDPASGPKNRSANDTVYLSAYTQARVLRWNVHSTAPELLGLVGHQQTRPTDAWYEPKHDALLVGTEPDYGQMNGALTIRELGSGEMRTYRGLIPDQTVRSVVSDGDVAYLGGATRNGLGTRATADRATLVAFDLRTRKVLWRAAPPPGVTSLTDLAVFRGLVYAVTDGGSLVVFDPARRKVISFTHPGANRSTLVEAGGRLYATDGDRLYRIDPRDSEAPRITTIADGLRAQWYGASPLLAACPDDRCVYALKVRNLVRIRLI
ncbi:outer membrane protein assembly factor BamB family protein [Flindersiella endophytica]